MHKHLTPLLEWKSPGLSWHVPFLAALGVGIPVFLGLWLDQPRQAMLAATGAMVILYLQPAAGPVAARMRRLIFCSAGFAICYIAAAASAFHPAAAVPALGLLTLLSTVICRRNRIAPPGSFFFIVIAAIACNAGFHPEAIPTNTAWLLFGSAVSCTLAFIYLKCSSGLRPSAESAQPALVLSDALQSSPSESFVVPPSLTSSPLGYFSSNDSAVHDSALKLTRATPAQIELPPGISQSPNLPAILVESSIIAAFVALSLLIGRLLHLDNPYWVPISCAAILQGGTFRAVWHRNVHRIVGTALGMGLSWFLFPSVPHPMALAITMVTLVFVVEYLVSRNYGLAVIFITPMTVCFAEFTSGGVPIHGLFATRLLDIILGSLIGAAGGSILHHPAWCRRMEARLERLLPTRLDSRSI